MLDLHNLIKLSNGMNTTTVTNNTPIVGTIIDTAQFDTAEFAILVGAVSGGGTFATTMEEGNAANLAGSNAVAAADLLGALPAFAGTDSNAVKKVGYRGTKRYIRITVTPSGNAANATFSAVCVQGTARQGPVA